jgi:NAD(P)-dependent dehydrogenase (short-subunit alcohol dehydrogenase family)
MTLQGKTALITGSTSGIGLAYAKALAAEGANIVINGFGDKDAIESERAALEAASGGKAIYSGHDLTKVEEIEAMMQEAAAVFGGVDILINNAGMQHVAPVEEFPLDKWNLIIALNLNSAFHTCRLAIPFMKQSKWGSHHPDRIGALAHRVSLQVGLCHRQAWPRRTDQDHRAGDGDLWHHGQLHLARLCLDAAGREPDP